jgi:multiple sugar transport system substrate-binding protein
MTALTRRAALALPAALAAPAIPRAQGAVEITVHYAQPHIFKASFDAIVEAFARREPGIRVATVTSPNYEEGAQLLLRQAATGQLPDLSYQGFNRLRIFVERRIAQDLSPLLAREGDPAAHGYTPAILGLGRAGEVQAGLAYAASNPIAYYNADILRRAGLDPASLPADWPAVFMMATRIRALPDAPDSFYLNVGGDDWMFQALVYGHGGRMMAEDESDVAFDGPEGLAAMRLLDRMIKDGGMPNLGMTGSQQAFVAGRLGATYRSTAVLRNIIQTVGRNFVLDTAGMPVIDPVRGRLPTGGAAGVLTARDAAKREAAWKFLRFSTSAEGTAIMVTSTGYVPMNQIAIEDPRWLGAFYRENPLFLAAVRQLPASVPWYAFPGTNGVRITQAIVNNQMRIVEQRATPEEALRDMAAEVRRMLPRRS